MAAAQSLLAEGTAPLSEVASREMLVTVMTGTVLSTTTTTKESVLVLGVAWLSDAVQVIVYVPMGRMTPEATELLSAKVPASLEVRVAVYARLTLLSPLSVTVGSVQVAAAEPRLALLPPTSELPQTAE